MRKSNYTVLLVHGEAVILYITLWNTSMIIHKNDVATWGLTSEMAFEAIQEPLKKILVDKKFFIEDDVDELKLIEMQLQTINCNKDYFELTIIPTLACNFRCWYCYEDHNTTEHMSEADCRNIISFLHKKVAEGDGLKTIKFQFFGGEPLICYNNVVKPLLEMYLEDGKLSAVPLVVGITTNGYLLTPEVASFLSQFINGGIQITLDGNKDRHNSVRFSTLGVDTYSVIVRNIKSCLKHGLNVCLRLNISEETDLNGKELLADFSDLNDTERELLIFSVHKVWQANDLVHEIIERIIAEIRAGGFRAASYYSEPSSIWSTCYADKKNHLVINPQGRIYKCTARNFSASQVEGILGDGGNVEWTPLHAKRESCSPLKNKACTSCPILPICVGGCSQKQLEHGNKNECMLAENEESKLEYALQVYKEKINILNNVVN